MVSGRNVCGAGNGLRGCGGVSIVGEPLEEFVTDAVLFRLDTPALAEALSRTDSPEDRSADLLSSLRADEAQLEELARAYARKQISLSEWAHRSQRIEGRLAAQRDRLQRTDHQRTLRAVAGQGNALRRRWPELNLDQRRAVIDTLVDRLGGPSRPAPQAHPIDPDAWSQCGKV